MATVLLVEDEDSLRETLRRYLIHEGHEVIAAASGGEALDVGIGMMPDVLIADWMLKNHIHGLHVSQIFRALNPNLNTILITGFPSTDLVEESTRVGVMRLLEKPFDLSVLHQAVDDAAASSREGGATAASSDSESVRDGSQDLYQTAPVAALALSADGRIEFASERARELLAAHGVEGEPETLDAIFGGESIGRIAESEIDWISMAPANRSGAPIWLRSRLRIATPGWILVLVPQGEEQRRSDPRIRLLLDDRNVGSSRSLVDAAPVVVIERDGVVRRLLVSQIERSGALCYPSDDLKSAIRLLLAEPRVQTVLVDCSLAGDDLATWAAQIRAARPGATIIGTGAIGAEESTLVQGVEKILRKPWRIRDLLDAIDS